MTFSPIEADVGGLLTKVINTVERTSNEETVSELRLLRVILERLECSFARQEAKLDKLLNSQTSPCLEPPVFQRQQRSLATPSPHLNGQSTLAEVEKFLEETSTSDNILTLREKSEFNIFTYNDFNDLLSDGDYLPDLVVIGGNVNVKLSGEDYEYARAPTSPRSWLFA
ncbi:unnamed protein product [Porites evermanni]|uniref:Uncharacterized protein n=1 Tax=Porites evermanni TaxID=104178 RepID=A0ABN8Q1U9_9CNID|nr:unnamed protein product [Porites evermanni]